MVDVVPFPSMEWMKEYCKALNASKELEEAGKGWGVGWNGDFIFQVEGIPIDNIDVEAVMKAMSKDLAISLAEQMGQVSQQGGTAYAHAKLKDGKCEGVGLLKSVDEVEVGFIMSGPYENWKKIVKGQLDPVRGLLSGQFKLKGDMSKIMKYVKGATIMARISATVKAEFFDEKFPKK
ncbi:MAG: SCP-2 sterol transfer family protein [Candidatus Bathyarchaeota archaeon BA2]|nr:MAG: SCP-2 sterol transfer family protein [Candidatus Bathyarchaeota archaeon BA2]